MTQINYLQSRNRGTNAENQLLNKLEERVFLSRLDWDSPGHPVVKTSTSSAGDEGLIPG